MVYVLALLVFGAPSAACRVVSVACYRGTVAGSDSAAAPDYNATAAEAVGVASLTSFVPFPYGHPAGLVVWAAAFGGLALSAGRAAVLSLDLAASSFAVRLVVLGVTDLLGNEPRAGRNSYPRRRDRRWRSPSSSTSCT